MYANNIQRLKTICRQLSTIEKGYIERPHQNDLAHEHTHYSLNQWEHQYLSPFGLLHLNHIQKLTQLDRAPVFLVRDGLFLMCDFFNRFKKNRDFRTLFLIHHSAKDFVPLEWRENVLFFEYEYTRKLAAFNFTEDVSHKKLILKFSLLQKSFSLEKFKKTISKIKKYDEITLCFSFHESNHFLNHEWDGGAFVHQAFSEIENAKKLCLEKAEAVKTLPFKPLQNLEILSEFDYWDIGDTTNYFIDDFTNHHCFKLGATPLFMENQNAHEDDIVIPLSFYHGIRVLSHPQEINTLKMNLLQEGLRDLDISPGEKFTTSAFQLLNTLTEDINGSSWIKTFST